MASHNSDGDIADAKRCNSHDTQGMSTLPEQRMADREGLLMIWNSLSPQGRQAVIIAAHLTAHEEGLIPDTWVLR